MSNTCLFRALQNLTKFILKNDKFLFLLPVGQFLSDFLPKGLIERGNANGQTFHLNTILITMLTTILAAMTFILTIIIILPSSFLHHPSPILEPASHFELDSNVIPLVSYYFLLCDIMTHFLFFKMSQFKLDSNVIPLVS